MTAAAKHALGIHDDCDAPTEVQTQLVCDPLKVPRCKCAGVDGDLGEFTCDCGDANIAGNCDQCGSPLILINVNTGEPVEAKS